MSFWKLRMDFLLLWKNRIHYAYEPLLYWSVSDLVALRAEMILIISSSPL